MGKNMKWINCDLCESGNYNILYITKDRYFPDKNGEFQLVKCLNCGLIYLNPQPEPKDLENHYPTENYYAYKCEKEGRGIINNNKLDKWRYLRFAIINPVSKIIHSLRSEIENELAYLGPIHSGMRVLDVGCGIGDKLLFYKERGANTFGVEINYKACEEGRKRGHNMFCGELFEAKFKDEYFDIILFHQSLEHMFSPHNILKESHRILKRGGKIWISVPNHDSFQARIFRKWFYAIESPRHLFGFNKKTITRLLQKVGFNIEHIYTYSLPGGPSFSLEYWLNDHFKRSKPFSYGEIRVKWWYILAEAIYFLPRLIINFFNLGEILVIYGYKL